MTSVSNLPAATGVSASDSIPATQGTGPGPGVTRRITPAQIGAYIQPQIDSAVAAKADAIASDTPVVRVTALPADPEPGTLYLVRGAPGDPVEQHLFDDDGVEVTLAVAPGTINRTDLGDVTGPTTLNLASNRDSVFYCVATGDFTVSVIGQQLGAKFDLIVTQSASTGPFNIDFDDASGFAPVVGAFDLSQYPGATDVISGIVTPEGIRLSINPAVSPYGTVALKDEGISVSDPGTGSLESLHRIGLQVSGASVVFAAADLYRTNRRTHTAAMADTLPELAALGMTDGAWIVIQNDSAFNNILSAPAGLTVDGVASVTIGAGRSVEFRFDELSSMWRSANNDLTKALSKARAVVVPTIRFSGAGTAGLIASYSTQDFTYSWLADGTGYAFNLRIAGLLQWTTLSTNLLLRLTGMPVALKTASLSISHYFIQTNATPTYATWPGAGTQLAAEIAAGGNDITFYGLKSSATAVRVIASAGNTFVDQNQPFDFIVSGVVVTA